jgi:prepilin-type processing-associated H-X9-DG protein
MSTESRSPRTPGMAALRHSFAVQAAAAERGTPAEGRILFAGEHTSIANIGFLDGAVETGERAARRLLRRLAA